MVSGLPQIELPGELCSDCLESKQTRNSFNQQVPTRSRERLEVIFSDVCGPIQTDSLGGNKYFLSFIDDYSRKIWAYLLKRKSEVFEVFVKFKNLVEKQSGLAIKILRTDGGESLFLISFKISVKRKVLFMKSPPIYTSTEWNS